MGTNVERFRAAEQRLWESMRVEPSERFVDLKSGPRVRVLETGDGPPVLMIHGASNGGTSWLNLAAALPDFRCIALDRPGCGLSEPISGGRPLADLGALRRYATSLVPDVFDALGVERAAIVATSYGGYFGFHTAAAHPERVSRLVEFSWTVGAPVAKTPVSMRFAGVPGVGRLMESLPFTRGAARLVLRQVGLRAALENGQFTAEMLDWFVALLRDTDTLSHERRASPRIITPLRGFNEAVLFDDALLARIRTPVSLIWGEDDPNGGESIARAFAARLPDAELHLLPDAGHAPWIDDVDQCAALVREFLPRAASA